MIRVRLEITLDDAGRVNVSGPLNDAILCHGLLQLAADNLREYQARQKEENRLIAQVAEGIVLPAGE